MKPFIKYLSLILTIFFLSCNKWGNGYVEGTIFENGTNNPVAKAKVRLVSSHYGNQGLVLGDVESDENGHFKISYHNALSNSWRYRVIVNNNDGYPHDQQKDFSNRKESFDFYYDPVAYVKFHIKNNTANNFSLDIYSGDHISLGGPGYINQIYPQLLKVKGNGTTKITWNYLNNSFTDTVTINNKKDTIIYIINLN